MVKRLHTKYNLMIALDLYQPHYQNLLLVYLTFIIKNVEIRPANLNVRKHLKLIN